MPCPKHWPWRIQQIAEVAFQPWVGYSWSHVCTEKLSTVFFHPQTILWLDPKPAPFLPGHKCVPAPSSQWALETHSSTWRANPSAEVIPKTQTPHHRTQLPQLLWAQPTPWLLSSLKASWIKLNMMFSTLQRLSFHVFATKGRKIARELLWLQQFFCFRFCISFEWKARSETLGWECSVNPQIDQIRWKLESLAPSHGLTCLKAGPYWEGRICNELQAGNPERTRR